MKGLDIGTAFIVCMEQNKDGKQVIRSERDAFFEVPPGEFTKNMLNQSGVSYIKMEDSLFVIGDKAMEFAEVFGKAARRPLARGYISPREREALPILKQIIGAVLGSKKRDGETVVFSTPANAIDDIQRKNSLIYHKESLAHIIESIGYTPVSINEGLAVIYSELKDYQFSGISISFGAGMMNFCSTWLSVPIPELTFAVCRGGDWIDEQSALAVDEAVAVVCGTKESKKEFNLNTDYDAGISQALQVYYKELMKYAVMSMERAFGQIKRRFPKPIPIVISGGTVSPPGFLNKFSELVQHAKFCNMKGDKIEIGEVLQAEQPLYSVSKGCLIHGLINEQK